MMTDVDENTAHLLKRPLGLEVLPVPGAFHNTMPMMTDVAPYDNNDVRPSKSTMPRFYLSENMTRKRPNFI